MSGGSGGLWKRWFGRKGDADETPSGGSILAEMEPGPILSLGFLFDRAADEIASDYGLTRVLAALERLQIKSTFHCAAKLADTAPTQMAHIRDAGHEIACHGYWRESCTGLSDEMLSRIILRCRELLARRGIHPAGYHPPGHTADPRLCAELARQGFKYVSELVRDGEPCLSVSGPHPLVRMPVASNDTGYLRHPDIPHHVFDKHHALMLKLIRRRGFLALNYHVWLVGEHRDRLENVLMLIDRARQAGVKIRTFAEALPERYRPPPQRTEAEPWEF